MHSRKVVEAFRLLQEITLNVINKPLVMTKVTVDGELVLETKIEPSLYIEEHTQIGNSFDSIEEMLEESRYVTKVSERFVSDFLDERLEIEVRKLESIYLPWAETTLKVTPPLYILLCRRVIRSPRGGYVYLQVHPGGFVAFGKKFVETEKLEHVPIAKEVVEEIVGFAVPGERRWKLDLLLKFSQPLPEFGPVDIVTYELEYEGYYRELMDRAYRLLSQVELSLI